ncbi:hypothetical protein GCM10010294_54890 [Streptomyces griseoloalbus]|nr:hypothetical protein GCM10010294_54890 [Streptomyces griseoloalbus]
MGDVRYGWCGAALPESAGDGSCYRRPAHRQATWRARYRPRAADGARRDVAVIQRMSGLLAAARSGVCHGAAKADSRQLVHSATPACRPSRGLPLEATGWGGMGSVHLTLRCHVDA